MTHSSSPVWIPQLGFEPRLNAPEALVLPLHHRGVLQSRFELEQRLSESRVLPLHHRRIVIYPPHNFGPDPPDHAITN
jgi:hypothetical protein